MMKKVFLIFVLCLALDAQNKITLEFLKSKPEGIARDFYIWQFLQYPETTLQETIEAYKLVFRKNDRIEKLVAQKGYVHELPKDIRCKKISFEKLKDEDWECIEFGLKLSIIPSLSAQDIQTLIQKLSNTNPILAQEVQILSSKTPLNEMLKAQNAQIFSEIFYGLNLEQRLDLFDKEIAPEQITILANQNHPNFNKMLQYILQSNRFKNLKSSILKSNITQADEKILLLLGIVQLQNNQTQKAKEYFNLILNKAKSPLLRDKALFWLYLSSNNDKNFLIELAKSTNLNLYSIYATQTLGVKPNFLIISKLPDLKNSQAKLNITDPFAWQILRNQLIKISSNEEFRESVNKNLSYLQTEPHKAVMLTRLKDSKGEYFLMPYAQNLSWINNHQKALTFAVAKQESNLIPALVSTSYAIGMMQIMPFNLEPIAKALGKKNMNLNNLFDPQIALEFGRYYLQELEDEFKHPLFVAYAYNGGPGFWRRILKKKTLFVANRAYEPWISLELVPYEESKNYGQIVLANYIIYQELLGNKINLDNLLAQTLNHSPQTKEKK